MERLEVLRGPQGTLYGRNATGGVINLITAKPKLGKFEGSIKGEVGNYDSRRMVGMLNIPIVPESPPPPKLFELRHPFVVGLTTSADRLIQVRRNRLLSLNQSPETAYVDQESVTREVAFARRMFADNGWPVIDVTRRSIEETAAAIVALINDQTGDE